jgi:hypothetical protein
MPHGQRWMQEILREAHQIGKVMPRSTPATSAFVYFSVTKSAGPEMLAEFPNRRTT